MNGFDMSCVGFHVFCLFGTKISNSINLVYFLLKKNEKNYSGFKND